MTDEHVPFKDAQPFYRRNLEDGKRDIFSVSVNESRRAKLEDLKMRFRAKWFLLKK